VAIVAVVATGYVPLVLAGCGDAIVAGAAASQLRCSYVGRTFADCIRAVMTGGATSDHLGMINRRYRRKDIRAVAVFTDIRGLHVKRVFSYGVSTVVAAEAVICDVGMIKEHREPAHRAVAIIAVVTAGNVGRVLTGCRGTVVT